MMDEETNDRLFTPADLEELKKHEISEDDAGDQVRLIRRGASYPDIISSASLTRGIVRLEKGELNAYLAEWERYLCSETADPIKMVPASGAATRMFKDLYGFLDAERTTPETAGECKFFDNITNFAFYELLNEACLRNEWKSVAKLLEAGEYKTVVRNLLLPTGLGYGMLPKGLLRFHRRGKTVRTAMEEHLVEAALYAKPATGQVRVHFTVSEDHEESFPALLNDRKTVFENEYCVRYDITTSKQDPSTDTIALDKSGNLMRRPDGRLLFRPGGHGALIRNLDKIDADVIFIKNIDNVVSDAYKCDTVIYKKLLGGILVALRRDVFALVEKLSRNKLSRSELSAALTFSDQNFCISIPEAERMEERELQALLLSKLDRPLRVCGMVKNTGDPGGGPFVIREPDGITSLQILESSQIDMNRDDQRAFFEQGSYFNPVDLACSTRRADGTHYFLSKYVNPKTAFISEKTLDGKPLLALERPGLWNGAMHHWLTVFVEVPLSTFAPVKEVNDLLRPEHR